MSYNFKGNPGDKALEFSSDISHQTLWGEEDDNNSNKTKSDENKSSYDFSGLQSLQIKRDYSISSENLSNKKEFILQREIGFKIKYP